ncbi:nucleoside-diphosphate-sugar epimerase [Mycena crocata]|nr:nucleoside-diphosphate-sugar epimerase [Mycena crocata]
MAPQILITGSTGYIGGSVLAEIVKAHPEYSITAVLRKVSQSYTGAYPRVKTIVGSFDSADVLAKAASESDIIIHAGNSDHKGAMEALLTGFGRRTSPTFLIHLSGTACISDVYSGHFGVLNPRVWSDVADIEELANLPEDRIHTHVDRLVWAARTNHGAHIHTAIMCPPHIYGKGLGPGTTQSILVPYIYDAILAKKAAFYIGKGENVRNFVHIEDVPTLYLSIVEEALSGFYFNLSEEVVWKDIAALAGKVMASLCLQVISSTVPQQVTAEETQKIVGGFGIPLLGPYMFGSNSRSRADRARQLFDWKPVAASTLLDVLEHDLLAHHQDKQRKMSVSKGD